MELVHIESKFPNILDFTYKSKNFEAISPQIAGHGIAFKLKQMLNKW